MDDLRCDVFGRAVIRVDIRRAREVTRVAEAEQLDTDGIVTIVDVNVVRLEE